MRVAYVHPVIIPVIIGTIGVQQLKTIIRALPRSSRGPVMPQLINPRTGQVIEPGTKIHTVQGGHAWRFERLRKVDHHEHHVHVTKIVKGTRGRTFRGHREFHPSVFGLDDRHHVVPTRGQHG